MISGEQVWNLYERRKSDQDPLLNVMREVCDFYNGDIVVPLPELSDSEKPATANLIHHGIDQTAMRISSTLPDIECPAVYPRKAQGQGSVEWASIRRGAVASWWEASRVQRLLRKRSRFYVAYGSTPAEVRPDFKRGIPTYHWLNPLTTFPAPLHDGEMVPDNTVVAKSRTWEWLKGTYDDDVLVRLHSHLRGMPEPDDRFTVLRYVDDMEIVVVARAEGYQGSNHTYVSDPKVAVLLRVPNLAGVPLVVQPEKVTLDKLQGQFNQTLGMYMQHAEMTSLDLIATRKAVFPDLALEGTDGRVPQLADDEWKDGMSGEINVVQNGQVRVVSLPPGFRTSETLDRLERGMRLTGGIPALMGGEAGANIRTGRGQEVALSAAIDFNIQEGQETLAFSLEEENRIAFNVAKGFFGGKSKSYHVGLPKMKDLRGDYTPNKHFETDANRVVYSMPGADVNSASLAIGQRVSMGTMSKQMGRKIDPLIDDPEQARDEVMAEQLEAAVFAGIQQQANAGAIPIGDVARIHQLVLEENMELYAAVLKAQEEAQERQASQLPPDDPGLQPGLAQPGAGAEGTPQVPQAPQSLQNLRGILSSLRQPDSPRAGGTSPMARGAGS